MGQLKVFQLPSVLDVSNLELLELLFYRGAHKPPHSEAQLLSLAMQCGSDWI